MKSEYSRGLAFIGEGDTEIIFYQQLVRFICLEHDLPIAEILTPSNEIAWVAERPDKKLLIMFNNAECITNIAKSKNWFVTQCVKLFKTHWHVLLCYDTDDYQADITLFHQGFWQDLRTDLERKSDSIIDLAASADIEDVLLQDSDGVFRFLCADDCIPIPSRKKGKRKMSELFRHYGRTYHSGERARPLIESLDMQRIIDSGLLPLNEVVNLIVD